MESKNQELAALITPVSYTHLDVYKRQEFFDPKTGEPSSEAMKRVQAAALEEGLILLSCGVYVNALRFLYPLTIEAVSYTHLDVYKRQMIGRVLWDEFFNNLDWPMASAVAVVMILIILLPMAIYNKSQADLAEVK